MTVRLSLLLEMGTRAPQLTRGAWGRAGAARVERRPLKVPRARYPMREVPPPTRVCLLLVLQVAWKRGLEEEEMKTVD